jgi:hypothetical protein
MHFSPFFCVTQSRAGNSRFRPADGRGWWRNLAAASCALCLVWARPTTAPSPRYLATPGIQEPMRLLLGWPSQPATAASSLTLAAARRLDGSVEAAMVSRQRDGGGCGERATRCGGGECHETKWEDIAAHSFFFLNAIEVFIKCFRNANKCFLLVEGSVKELPGTDVLIVGFPIYKSARSLYYRSKNF